MNIKEEKRIAAQDKTKILGILLAIRAHRFLYQSCFAPEPSLNNYEDRDINDKKELSKPKLQNNNIIHLKKIFRWEEECFEQLGVKKGPLSAGFVKESMAIRVKIDDVYFKYCPPGNNPEIQFLNIASWALAIELILREVMMFYSPIHRKNCWLRLLQTWTTLANALAKAAQGTHSIFGHDVYITATSMYWELFEIYMVSTYQRLYPKPIVDYPQFLESVEKLGQKNNSPV